MAAPSMDDLTADINQLKGTLKLYLPRSPRGAEEWMFPYDAAISALQGISRDLVYTMEESVRKARTQRNLAAPVNRLPVEILTNIFGEVGFNAIDKLTISQTCRRWRDISLSYPLMWTSVDLDTVPSAYVASKIFRRGREYPLRLKGATWNDMRLRIIRFELFRIEELEITLDLAADFPWNLIESGSPALRHLHIISGPHHHGVLVRMPLVRSPQLQEITITGCRAILTTGNFHGLTKLCISCPDIFSTYKLDWDEDILQILSGCAQLEELTLEHVASNITDYADTYKVDLPRLHSARLLLHPSMLHHILLHISASNLRRLSSVSYIHSSIPVERVVDLLLDGQTIPSAYYPTLSMLADSQSLVVDNFASCLLSFAQERDKDPALAYISYDPRGQYSTLTKLLTSIITHHAMPRVNKLSLRNPRIAEVLMFLETLDGLQRLEIVYMVGQTTPPLGNRDVIKAILRKVKTHRSARVFPRLHTLSLERVYIGLDAISDLVELRQYCPSLQHLRFHWCKSEFSPEDATEFLRDVFESVEWTNISVHINFGQCHQEY